MEFEVGKPVAMEMRDGSTLRGFIHAADMGASLVCLEVIPSSQVALISTANVKAVSILEDVTEERKWPSNREFFQSHVCENANGERYLAALRRSALLPTHS